MKDAYIIDAVRTPVGKRNGALRCVRSDDMLSHVIKSIVTRNPGLDINAIDDVIVGCAMPEAEQGLNVARISSLLAGLPQDVPAYTINRFCASGLQAVANAANAISSGHADVILAGGVESMTHIPMSGHNPSLNIEIFKNDNFGLAYGMGLTAEKVAEQFNISKDAQNEFALNSHRKAISAQEQSLFDDEIADIKVVNKVFNPQTHQVETESSVVAQDEGPRKNTSLDVLNKLKPAFNVTGAVTAGNSSQMSDGAACVLVVSESALKRFNLTPIARFAGYATSGVAPEIMGIGPVAAIPKALKIANVKLADMHWIELNEAFAAQSLAVINKLDIDHEVVNPLGGAIALGHPLGATGAVKCATLHSAFKRNQQLKYGMITMCIGGGMGAAGIFENLN